MSPASDSIVLRARVLLCGVSLSMFPLLGGCQPVERTQGRDGQIVAVYRAGTVRATVPAQVAQVMAAAEQTLRDRGYAIESSASTTEQGGIVARPPMFNIGKTMRIDLASTADDQTTISISTQPWDETLVRLTLDRILERLGQ